MHDHLEVVLLLIALLSVLPGILSMRRALPQRVRRPKRGRANKSPGTICRRRCFVGNWAHRYSERPGPRTFNRLSGLPPVGWSGPIFGVRPPSHLQNGREGTARPRRLAAALCS